MSEYWDESFKDDEGFYRCTFCLDERRDLNGDDTCSDCPEDDHIFQPFVKQDGDNPPITYNIENDDHCTCCHLHLLKPSDEEVADALASIRNAITRHASSRDVVSPSGQRE